MLHAIIIYLAIGAAVTLPVVTPDSITFIRILKPSFLSDRGFNLVVIISVILAIVIWPVPIIGALLNVLFGE